MTVIASDATGARSEPIALPGVPAGSPDAPGDPPPVTLVIPATGTDR